MFTKGSFAPIRATPNVSSRQAFAVRTMSSGMVSAPVMTMRSESACVVFVMEMGGRAAPFSFRLNGLLLADLAARVVDDPGPLGNLVLDHFAECLLRADIDHQAHVLQACDDFLVLQRLGQGGMYLVDDGRGRALDGPDA